MSICNTHTHTHGHTHCDARSLIAVHTGSGQKGRPAPWGVWMNLSLWVVVFLFFSACLFVYSFAAFQNRRVSFPNLYVVRLKASLFERVNREEAPAWWVLVKSLHCGKKIPCLISEKCSIFGCVSSRFHALSSLILWVSFSSEFRLGLFPILFSINWYEYIHFCTRHHRVPYQYFCRLVFIIYAMTSRAVLYTCHSSVGNRVTYSGWVNRSEHKQEVLNKTVLFPFH